MGWIVVSSAIGLCGVRCDGDGDHRPGAAAPVTYRCGSDAQDDPSGMPAAISSASVAHRAVMVSNEPMVHSPFVARSGAYVPDLRRTYLSAP